MGDKRGRMSSAGQDRGEEARRDAAHLRFQFLIIIQKHYIGNISRREVAIFGIHECVVE
jgi:hypothetical protein